MDDTTGTAEDEAAGCEACTTWSGDFVAAFRQEPQLTTGGAFEIAGEYFSSYLVPCEACGTTWLAGYIEDFAGRPIEAEWGARWWTMRAVTPAMLEEIAAAKGTASLDIKTFAAHRPGTSWEQ